MSYSLLGSVINDTDLTANLADEAYLGYSSSINDAGDKVVVAAWENEGTNGRGRIFAYQYSGGRWSAYGDELRGPEDSVGGNHEGTAADVDMNGDGTIFISGHPSHDRGTVQSNVADREGAVMIKKYNSGTSVWDDYGPSFLTTLPFLEDGNGDHLSVDKFGEMVGITGDGNTIIIGARYSDVEGNNSGAIFTYTYKIPSGSEWSATPNLVFKDGDVTQTGGKYYWVLIGNASTNATSGGTTAQDGISLVGTGTGDLFGATVDINYTGSRIAVGIVNEDEGGLNSGMVRMYEYNSGTDKWEQLGQDLNGDVASDKFGYRLELNKTGSRVAIATRSGGYAKVYEYNTGTSQWDLMGSNSVWDSGNTDRGKFSINTDSNAYSNRFVSLNDDGDVLAVGHSVDNTVNVYQWDGSSNWTQVGGTLDSSLGSVSAGDGFGASGQLSKNGDYLIVGSTFVDTGGTDAGQFAIYYNSSLSSNSSDVSISNVETAAASTTLKNEIVSDLNSIAGVSISASDISASSTIISTQDNVDYEFTVTIANVDLSDLSGAEQTSLINVLKSRYATDLSLESSRFTITLREGSIEADVEIGSAPAESGSGNGKTTIKLSGKITIKGIGKLTIK
jgi:hypothetical protein